MTGCLTRGNDANELVGADIAIGMHDNHQNHFFSKADRVPSRIAFYASFDEGDTAGIGENQLRGLKVDAMLQEIALVLLLIPFEANHVRMYRLAHTGRCGYHKEVRNSGQAATRDNQKSQPAQNPGHGSEAYGNVRLRAARAVKTAANFGEAQGHQGDKQPARRDDKNTVCAGKRGHSPRLRVDAGPDRRVNCKGR